jgi:hypothetical protein
MCVSNLVLKNLETVSNTRIFFLSFLGEEGIARLGGEYLKYKA